MPHVSRAEMIRFARGRLTSSKRFVDALLVVEDHEGTELLRVGGRWNRSFNCWVKDAKDVKPHVIRLKESQQEAGRGLAKWLESSRLGVVDPLRAIVMLLGGARGSGKTWFVGLAIVVIGIEWQNEWQYSVNLSTGQRREVIEAIEEVALPDWILGRSDDLRDPWLQFLTGSTVAFTSARNPKRLREAKLRIRAVHINEGQDQPEEVYVNAVSATRNVDGLTTIATNRPRNEAGDWVSLAASGIEGGEIVGLYYLLDPRKNDAVSRVALDKRAAAIRVVSAEAAAADTDPDAPMKLAGPIAYPGFRPLPIEKGGHIGEPPAPPQVGKPLWRDVTAEVTAKLLGGDTGFPYIGGVDFQRQPGIICSIAKLYRNEAGLLVLHVVATLAVRGVEPDFSHALVASGYRPAHGMDGEPILLIGDATGARQNSEHKFAQPPSFTALRSDGWKIVPPMKHWRRGTPWNPLVHQSRTQMHALFEGHQILLAPRCREPSEGFPSLVESLRRAKVGPKGGLIEKGNFQHGPDGVRYMAWWALPRPKPPAPNASFDRETFDALSGIKIVST
jgi:hypothetical protein